MRILRSLPAIPVAAVFAAALAALANPLLASPQQAFTPEIALDVRTPGIAAVTHDGAGWP